jgi:hypothetical protein
MVERQTIEKGTAMNEHNAQPLKVLDGISARLELYPDRVTLIRTDILGQLIPQIVGSSKTILLDQIESVQVYTSRFLTTSRIQFSITDRENNSISLTCSSRHLKLAHEIKEMIENFKGREDVA